MDKQSKLIFERYTRRTILEQTPVNNIAPVNVGVTKPTTTTLSLSDTPAAKTTEFSNKNWSQIGSELGLSVSKFFAENPMGIALSVLDVTQITTAIQLPYLISQFQKDPSTINTIFLLLGATSLVPVLGNAPEAYNVVGRGLITAGKFTGKELQKFISNLRSLAQEDSLLSKIYEQLPPEMQNIFNQKLKELEGLLNKGDVLTLEKANISDLSAAILELQKTGQLTKIVTNIAPGMLIDPAIIKGVSKYNPARAAKTVTGEGVTKIREIAEKIQSIAKGSKIIIDLPTSLVDGVDELTKSLETVYNTLRANDYNSWKNIAIPLQAGIGRIKYVREILLKLGRSMSVNITGPQDVVKYLDEIIYSINNTPRIPGDQELIQTLASKVETIKGIIQSFPDLNKPISDDTIEAAEKASKQLWDLYTESIQQISSTRKNLTSLLGSKAPDLAKAPSVPYSVDLDIPTKVDISKKAKAFDKLLKFSKGYLGMNLGFKPGKGGGWSAWLCITTFAVSITALSAFGALLYFFGESIVGSVVDTTPSNPLDKYKNR